jgi:hypothetical protein
MGNYPARKGPYISGASYLRSDGSVPLTDNWSVGNFGITATHLNIETVNDLTENYSITWTPTSGWAMTLDYGQALWTHSTGTTGLKSPAFITVGDVYIISMGGTWVGGAEDVLTVTLNDFNGPQVTLLVATSEIGSDWSIDTKIEWQSSPGFIVITPTTGFTGTIQSVSITKETYGYLATTNIQIGPDAALVPNGAVTAPSYAFIDTPSTGMFYDSTNVKLAFSLGGVSALTLSTFGPGFNFISEYADNEAALSQLLTEGMLYRTGDLLKIVH